MAGRAVMHSEEWWAAAPPHVIRCTAHYKSNGQPCRRVAAPGTNVCNQHGALAPQVVAAAAVRVQMSADEAARKLLAMVEDPKVKHRDKIKILQDILDRSGVTGVNKLLVGVVTQDPVEQLFQSLLSHPDALAPPESPTPVLAVRDTAQEAYEAGQDPFTYDDLLARREAISVPEDVVQGEVVEAATTPPHIREAMRDLL